MLFTDQDIVTAADLSGIDSEVDKVASAEKLKLEGDNSIIRASMAECSRYIMARMQAFGGYVNGGGISSAHLQAVMNTGGGPASRAYVMMSNIVADSKFGRFMSAMQSWAAYHALFLVFRAAQNRNLNDRYQFKMDGYQRSASDASGSFLACGLPITLTPLPCPGAVHEPMAGIWAEDNVSLVAGSGASGTNYVVAITYTGAAYNTATDKNNAESGPSRKIRVVSEDSKVIRVDITSLTPPSGLMPAVGTADGVVNYMAATGWNVYVGREDSAVLYLQNASPIAIATKTYTLADDPVLSGYQLGSGQFADMNYAFAGHQVFRA